MTTDWRLMANLNGMTLDEFVALARRARRQFPRGVKLVKNEVGNLAAVSADYDRHRPWESDFYGYVDFTRAEVELVDPSDYRDVESL